VFDPAQGEFAAQQFLADPAADPADLAAIAGAFPALAPQVAAHPRLYPDLEAWLRQLGRPDVDAALGARARWPQSAEAAPPPPGAPSAAYPLGGPYGQSVGPGAAYPPDGDGAACGTPYGSGAAGDPYAPEGLTPYALGAGPEARAGAPGGGKKRGRKGLWVAVAAVAVVVLAAGAVWFFVPGLRGGKTASGNPLAADFEAKPKFEEVVDLKKLFPDASNLRLLDFVDDATVLVKSEPEYSGEESSWYQGYDQDYASGESDRAEYEEAYEYWWECDSCDYPDEDDYMRDDYDDYGGYWDGWNGQTPAEEPVIDDSATILAAVDLRSPDKAKWTLNLNEALSLPDERLTFEYYIGDNYSDGQGNLIIPVCADDSDSDECYWVGVDYSSGKLLSSREYGGSSSSEYVTTVAQGVALITAWDSDSEDASQAAYKLTDLETQLWEADCPQTSCGVIESDGSVWVLTEDGAVDLVTGKDVGFKRSLDDNEWAFGLAGSIFVVEADDDSGEASLMRVSKDGEDAWDKSINLSALPVIDGGTLYFLDEERLVAVDLKSGERDWRTSIGDVSDDNLCVAGNGGIVVEGYQSDGSYGSSTLTIVEPKEGEKVKDDLDGSLLACGGKMVYAWDDDDRLVAYSTADGDKLWSLNPPDDDVSPQVTPGGHFYFTSRTYDYDSETDTEELESFIIYELTAA
jgi:hypothetical protein